MKAFAHARTRSTKQKSKHLSSTNSPPHPNPRRRFLSRPSHQPTNDEAPLAYKRGPQRSTNKKCSAPRYYVIPQDSRPPFVPNPIRYSVGTPRYFDLRHTLTCSTASNRKTTRVLILGLGYSRSVWNRSMEGIGVDEKRSLAVDFGLCNAADGGDRRIWSSREWGQKIATGKRIFCNRSLNMKNIIAVGFDMDYTLAQYKPETFESMAYDGTVKKLVYNLGYPHEVCDSELWHFCAYVNRIETVNTTVPHYFLNLQILEWTFDSKYMVRGLVLDKKRGNILKVSLLNSFIWIYGVAL
ncbi:hypothetical protein B296_00026059 [Ensete ventricosum]|uniref:5'-nucleotidase n=1 Tax=Ensete ventricosum TaxID=4639 RepID=A0A427AHZ0_ENSVE|nr:hypothetical protein B296_00026059 [Ensete ventricosum]